MPFKILSAQSRFQFAVVDEMPLAPVEQWGAGRWLTCCPLCGMLHEVPAGAGDTFRPNCSLPKLHPTTYQEWLARHPQSAQYQVVRLVSHVESQPRSSDLAATVADEKKANRVGQISTDLACTDTSSEKFSLSRGGSFDE